GAGRDRDGLRARRAVQNPSEGRRVRNPAPGRLQDGREMVRVQVPRGGGPPRAHRAENDPVRGGVREEGDEARGRPAAGGGGCQGRRRTRDSRGDEAPEESDCDEAQADQAAAKGEAAAPREKAPEE